MVIRIRDWAKLYELPKREKEGDGPLEYVRWKCYAHHVTVGFADLADACPDGYMAAMGLFGKLLEFAGAQPRATRDGAVRDNRGHEASVHWISRRLLGAPMPDLARWMGALAIAGWIDLDAASAGELEELSGLKAGALPVTLPARRDPRPPITDHEDFPEEDPEIESEPDQPRRAGDDDHATNDDGHRRETTAIDGRRRPSTGDDGHRRETTAIDGRRRPSTGSAEPFKNENRNRKGN